MFCQSLFCFQFNNSHFRNLQITLEIYIMEQSKVNRQLENLGAGLTSTDMSEGYVIWIK